jgi:ribokinase
MVNMDVFVVGTASLDVLHLADGRTVQTVGGAGLYTALAARRAGAKAGLYAPRPEPLPNLMQPVVEKLNWVGPIVPADQTPRLEIKHHGQGRATLVGASWGAEAQLTLQLMPAEVAAASLVHIAALSTAGRQLEFLEAFKQHRAMTAGQRPLISVGTYARLVYGETGGVRHLFELADLFFMNENEAGGLFGSVGQAQTGPEAVLFVTLAAEGALVIEGSQVTHVPGRPAAEVDPTGAGDTFCGATLAGLAQGRSPVVAAQYAVQLAAQTVSTVGPGALWV